MGGIKLKIHPLFFIVGLYYALTGRMVVFVIYTLSSVLHEAGHSLIASGVGYRLNKVYLMPFGAVVNGEGCDFNFKDEIKIALAGPFTNLSIAIFFVAIWWVFPEVYAYTDVLVEANLALALINFIPAYPLDGGRVLCASISMCVGRKKALKFCRVLGIVFFVFLVGLFIFSIKSTVNYSILLFAFAVLFGAISREKENVYVRLFTGVQKDKLRRGIIVKRHAVDDSITVKGLLKLLDVNAVNEISVFRNGEIKTVLSQDKLIKIANTGELYAPISKYLSK